MMENDKFKIVFLTGGSTSSNIVFNQLSKKYTFDKVIVEESTPFSQIIYKRFRRLGFFTTLNQLIFLIFRKFIFKFSIKRINEIKSNNNLNTSKIPSEIITNVKSINDDLVIEILKNSNPDLVIVNGTRIISKNVLNCIDCFFVNTHVGITPKYRGVHGAYWAVVNNDIENCGVAVHLIDEGIDTGDVLYQDLIKPNYKKDNFTTYPYLQIAKALPLLEKVIIDCETNKIKAHKVNLPSKIWSHPTFSFYFVNLLKGKK